MTFPELMERYQVLEGHSSEPRIYSGFQGTVDVGWIPLLEDLLGELVALGWDRRLDQVKQKFGGLRFYAGSTTTEMDAAIDRAEAREIGRAHV